MSHDYDPDATRAKIRENRHLPFISDVIAMSRYLVHAGAVDAAVIIGALVYFVSPIDAIPDLTPVVGYIDDAAVIAAAVARLGHALDRYRS
jgi:uncharacterized membrane protein YkvA (DUF1232 family)